MDTALKLDEVKLGVATTLATGVFWVVCSILVLLMPTGMMSSSGWMMHMDMAEFGWRMTWGGFFFGGILWSLLAGLFVWLIAAIYNRI